MMTAIEALLGADHAELDELLASVFASLGEGSTTTAYSRLDLFWARLAMHIRAEHLHLFPAVLKICESEVVSDVPEILKRLRRDHDLFMHELADAIKSMRGVTPETEPDVRIDVLRRLESVKERLVEHNAIEEEQIYSLRRLLSPGDQQTLSRSIARELANLPPRIAKRR